MEESREMATMEDHSDAAQPDYLQVAKLLRERLSDFLEGDSGELPGEKLRRLLYIAASHKVVSYTLMIPVLWGRLPRELLVLVLARLPVPEITRLRCQLSKEWTMNVELNRACDEANPNMGALVSYVGQANEFSVRIFDFSKYEWLYVYCFRVTNQGNAPSWFDTLGTLSVWMPMASDGGLVCFVSTWKYTKANPLCIVVINPLTRVQYELPPLQDVYTVPPTLVHMKVDCESNGYQVVVVGNNEGRYTAETYDSVLRQWRRTAPTWGRILGRVHEWKNDRNRMHFHSRRARNGAFDLVGRQPEHFSFEDYEFHGARVMRYAITKDRMFALLRRWNANEVITVFQSQSTANEWVPVNTHGRHTHTEEGLPVELYACEDVLMVLMLEKVGRKYGKKQRCCFVDFSRGEWHDLPEFSQKFRYPSLMCRVFWNAIPRGIM